MGWPLPTVPPQQRSWAQTLCQHISTRGLQLSWCNLPGGEGQRRSCRDLGLVLLPSADPMLVPGPPHSPPMCSSAHEEPAALHPRPALARGQRVLIPGGRGSLAPGPAACTRRASARELAKGDRGEDAVKPEHESESTGLSSHDEPRERGSAALLESGAGSQQPSPPTPCAFLPG